MQAIFVMSSSFHHSPVRIRSCGSEPSNRSASRSYETKIPPNCNSSRFAVRGIYPVSHWFATISIFAGDELGKSNTGMQASAPTCL